MAIFSTSGVSFLTLSTCSKIHSYVFQVLFTNTSSVANFYIHFYYIRKEKQKKKKLLASSNRYLFFSWLCSLAQEYLLQSIPPGAKAEGQNYSATAPLEMADVQDDMPKHTNTLKALLMLHLLTSHWTKESQGRTQMQLVLNALQPQSSGKGSYCFSILVSVPSGCFSRKPQTRGLRNNRTLFLVVLETGKFSSRHQQICCLVRAHFLVHRQPSFCCILTWQMG